MPTLRPHLLLTRPLAQSEQFARACRDRLGDDLPVVISPLLSIRFMTAEVDLDGIEAVVATSANGIEALAQLVELAGRKAFCVGDATAAAADAAGMQAVSAEGDAAALIALVQAQKVQGPLLYARGAEVRTDIAAALSAADITVHSAVLYDQRPTDPTPEAFDLLRGSLPVVLPLFSPRSAALAGEALIHSKARIRIAAISRAAAEAWTGPRPEMLAIARRPDGPAMIDEVARLCDGASS